MHSNSVRNFVESSSFANLSKVLPLFCGALSVGRNILWIGATQMFTAACITPIAAGTVKPIISEHAVAITIASHKVKREDDFGRDLSSCAVARVYEDRIKFKSSK